MLWIDGGYDKFVSNMGLEVMSVTCMNYHFTDGPWFRQTTKITLIINLQAWLIYSRGRVTEYERQTSE